MELKEELYKFTITVEDFSLPFWVIDRTNGQN